MEIGLPIYDSINRHVHSHRTQFLGRLEASESIDIFPTEPHHRVANDFSLRRYHINRPIRHLAGTLLHNYTSYCVG